MRFIDLNISDFRNISSASINVDAEDIVLTGINGQGKTNLLEAIYNICYGSSFRTISPKDCIRHSQDGFNLKATFINDYNEREKINVSFYDNKRKILVNGKEIKDRKELIYSFPCIVFCHEDIEFIKGEPENRRKFFDQMMTLYSPVFFDNLRSYRAILAQRNAAIKNESYELLSLYNERLAYYGLEIMAERTSVVYEFNKIFPEGFKKVSGTDLDLNIEYIPSWKNFGSVDEIVSYLEETSERDIRMSTTTSGIHRDKFVIQSENGPFASIGSTGQLRLCSLLFRISEAIYFTQKTGKKPILLIDDVLLELDSEKRARLLKFLDNYSQAFYTFLPYERYSEKMENALYYTVEEGNFILDEKN